MGSFAAQAAILDHSLTWSGVILSGSTALDLFAAAMANAPADAPAGLAAFNAGFEHRTGYEWLSRDAAEVDAYVADPWCGWDMPYDVIPSLFASAPRLGDPALPREAAERLLGADDRPTAIFASNDDMALGVMAVANRLRAGQVNLNSAAPDLMAPFGGFKQSGNGREWGEHAFGEFLETKAVLGYAAKA